MNHARTMTTPSVVGIDLGTTFSLAAYVENRRPVVVRDEFGVALVPSAISFHDNGTVLVGSAARDRALSDPEHTIFSVKRLMGRSLADLRKNSSSYRIRSSNARQPTVEMFARPNCRSRIHAGRTRALILGGASAGNPTKAVITVPAYFDDSQRQATATPGESGSTSSDRTSRRPQAAYGLDEKTPGHRGIRSRRRHLRLLDPIARRWRLQSAVHERRYLSRRRRL